MIHNAYVNGNINQHQYIRDKDGSGYSVSEWGLLTDSVGQRTSWWGNTIGENERDERWGLSMSSLEVTFTGYLFTLTLIAIAFLFIMPRAPREARMSTAARECRARHTPATDEEENLGTSRFRNPGWQQVRRHPLTPYPSIDNLNWRVRHAQDHYDQQTGAEFADLWLTDQLTARYQIMRPQCCRVNVPTWLRHILDRAGEVDIDTVNAAKVHDYVHRVVAFD